MKARFNKNPELIDNIDHDRSKNHNKNFGLSQWNDNDIDDDDEFDSGMESIFAGTAEDETKKVRKELFDQYYG